MEKLWSKFWKSSTQRRKQRKYIHRSPLHIKGKFLNVNLSSDLRKEYGIRSFRTRKDDFVKVCAGQFKEKTGKIVRVSLIKSKVYIEKLTTKKNDGTTTLYPIHPSNIKILKFDLKDNLREEKLKKIKQKKEEK